MWADVRDAGDFSSPQGLRCAPISRVRALGATLQQFAMNISLNFRLAEDFQTGPGTQIEQSRCRFVLASGSGAKVLVEAYPSTIVEKSK